MKSRMKKSLCLLGAVMIGAAIVFSGCGSSAGGDHYNSAGKYCRRSCNESDPI